MNGNTYKPTRFIYKKETNTPLRFIEMREFPDLPWSNYWDLSVHSSLCNNVLDSDYNEQ